MRGMGHKILSDIKITITEKHTTTTQCTENKKWWLDISNYRRKYSLFHFGTKILKF